MDYSSLARLASGHVEARIIQVAVSMKVFDALKDRSLNASSLASSLRADPRGTELLLNALAAIGLLEKESDRFSLNRVSCDYLVTSSPKYYGAMILFDSALWSSWGSLEKAVHTGKAVRSPDMFQGDPHETERFILAMDSLVKARGDAEVLANTLDLSQVNELLDIGSGPGTYAIHLCQSNPHLRAKLFDLPGTMNVTERCVRTAGMEDRIELITGDYRYDSIPGSYQMIFLFNIIHSESAEENARLIKKLYPCLEAGGRVVIKDHILDDSLRDPPVGAIFALLMMLTTKHGRCYSFNEVKEWLKTAGFTSTHQIHLPPPLTSSLVVGIKG